MNEQQSNQKAKLNQKLQAISTLLTQVEVPENEWQVIEESVNDLAIRLTALGFSQQMKSDEEFDWF
ncbi:hypothetical protein [Neptunicella marina]|uniref:Uncharacterized protein n=1 Tax=Neptunicella marina TaxID=2125989 RepID=A0A8J6ISB5_9ALTE|nr:hypothetical protein [Neptunicella marina]MBC3764503.1 hypothetical protein [Neptunicella marina]